MSLSCTLFVKDIDDSYINSWIEELNKLNMECEIHPEFSFKTQEGYLPFKVEVKKDTNELLIGKKSHTGFEYYMEDFDIKEHEEFYSKEIDEKLADKKYRIDFIFKAFDTLEFRTALLANATLTKITDGLSYSEEEDEWYDSSNIIKQIYNEVIEYEKDLDEREISLNEVEEEQKAKKARKLTGIRKTKYDELNLWAEYFPEYSTMLKEEFLLRRNGCLLNGLVLVPFLGTRYEPQYTIHDLLLNMDCMAALLEQNMKRIDRWGQEKGKNIIYGRFKEEDALSFREQLKEFQKPLSFKTFFNQAIKLSKDLEHRLTLYAPEFTVVLSTIIRVGVYCGDKDFYLDNLPKILKIVDKYKAEHELDAKEWEGYLKKDLDLDFEEVIKQQMKIIGLPEMKDEGLEYERVDDMLDIFEDVFETVAKSKGIKI